MAQALSQSDRRVFAGPLRSEQLLVLGMIVVGAAVRVAVAATTRGLPFDVQSWAIVRAALSHSSFHFYAHVNPQPVYHWPYPPGFLLLVPVISGLSELSGWGFGHLIRLPAIATDCALAWLIWRGLEGRTTARLRLLATAMVALGPVFITISSYAAQIDSVAILPAVIALLVWERDDAAGRAWLAGALIGLAAAVKTVPVLMVLALAPSAKSWRELAELAVAAGLVLVVAFAPFVIADASAVVRIVHYTGVPGMGGLSLVLQPDLAQIWLTRLVHATGLTTWLFVRHAGLETAAVVVGYAAYVGRYRPRARIAAAVLWLVVLAFGSGFFFQYLVWGLPFFLLAGYVRATALLQVVVAVPMVIYYLGPWHSGTIVYPYVVLMLAVWGTWVGAIALLSREGHRART